MRILQYAAQAALAMLLGAACAPVSAPRVEDPTVVTVTREFQLTLHADTDFSLKGRELVEAAAKAWTDASQGRIRLEVVYDLDLEDVENLRWHLNSKHSMLRVVGEESRVVHWIDETLGKPGRKPVAATTTTKAGEVYVYIIVDRVQVDQAQGVLQHEFGHVVGLPDLPTFGSIMSAAHFSGQAIDPALTESDLALCRAYRYCQ